MTDIPSCPTHGIMVARKGRFGPFWSCKDKMPDGSWCQYRTPKSVAPPTKEQLFDADLDKTKRSEEKSEADAKRTDDIAWMNSRILAKDILIAGYEKGEVTSIDAIIEGLESTAQQIYDIKKPQ